MGPRLQHKKSRNGCKRCKARRVKCDETHPVCNNCKRHGAVCESPNVSQTIQVTKNLAPRSANASILDALNIPIFLGTGSSPQDSAVSPHASPSQYMGIQSPYEPEDDDECFLDPDARRLLELRLMHHFTSVVSCTFPSATYQAVRDIWTIDAVRAAFDHRFLLNAMFAVAALHLVRGLPVSPRFFADADRPLPPDRALNATALSLGNIDAAKAHRFYLNLAIRQQRQAISNISIENANALILSSVLISYQGLKLLPDYLDLRVYSPPTQWLHMTNAITRISNIAFPLVQDQSVAHILAKGGEPDFQDRATIFNPVNSKPFERLLKHLQHEEPDFYPDIRVAYEKTLDYIGGVHKAIQDNEAPRSVLVRIFCIGPMIPPRFISLVEEGRPRALAILAHHFAMAKAVDDHWMFHGLAEREVSGIQSILPLNWQWAMEWPVALLQRDFSSS